MSSPTHTLLLALVVPAVLVSPLGAQDRGTARPASTRIESATQHAYAGNARYPFRDRADYILAELDLRPGDVVVDIGAGDGWWSGRMAERVGADGVVHAAEVDRELVDEMQERFADDPRIKPYLCPTDGTALPEDSVDLALFSQVYHHLDEDGRVDYFRHLQKVVRPTGRICVIERATPLSRPGAHGSDIAELAKVAHEGGWVLVRYELMPKTYHFIALFVQKELFPPEPRRGRRRGR